MLHRALLSAVGDIELGELLCDSLDVAPDSSLLRFTISSTEVRLTENSPTGYWPRSKSTYLVCFFGSYYTLCQNKGE